jgi:SAM-dependent methyltransferase
MRGGNGVGGAAHVSDIAHFGSLLASEFDWNTTSRIQAIRETFPFDERRKAIFERGVNALDSAKVEALARKYSAALHNAKPNGKFKYLDVGYWLWHKAPWLILLDLDRTPPKRILDLGCGASQFGFLCQAYGHSVLGLDVDVPVYIDLCEALGVKRMPFRIERGGRLPTLGERFDLLTAFDVCFNYGATSRMSWTLVDWHGFLTASANLLSSEGRLALELNTVRSAGGVYAHDYELIGFLLAAGAESRGSQNRLIISRETLDKLVGSEIPHQPLSTTRPHIFLGHETSANIAP